MSDAIQESSPRALARTAAVFQLLEAITATYGQVIVIGGLVVAGNAAATAANLLGHERSFWLGFASSLIGIICHVAWALCLYDLFKPVNRRVSLMALLAILVGSAMQAVTSLFYVAPFLVLRSGGSLSAFTTDQLQALALTFFKLNAYAFDIYLVFFGLWCALIGYLMFRATFVPRVLGVLLMISGLGWMMFLYPPLARHLFMPWIAGASGIGEVPLMLWLLIVGVNEPRWKARASRAVAVSSPLLEA